MAEIEFDERMSESDAVLWYVERDPLLRSTVTSVWALDKAPRRARMDAVVERLVERLPRLRQRVVEEPGQISTPRWDDDPYFDPTHHYQWVRLAGRSPGRRDALNYIAHLSARAFDTDRPLWELTVIEGSPKGQTFFVMKVHHAIADGLGLVQMLQHMVDLEADPPAEERAERRVDDSIVRPRESAATRSAKGVVHRIRSDVRTGQRAGRAAVGVARGLVTKPISTAQDVAGLADSIVGLIKPTSNPLSNLLAGRSMSPRFDVIAIPLDDLKAAAKLHAASLNDAFVSSVLSGLDRYHRELDAECAEIRMLMPVSIRGGTTEHQSGNQFVPTRMVLPLGDLDPATRLGQTREHLAEVRAEPALPLMGDISAMIGRLGPTAAVTIIGSMIKGVDITTSNVPGPPFPVFLAGRQVDEFYAFGPLAGSAVNLTLFSYDSSLFIGVHTDQAAVIDPERFVSCLEAGFAETTRLTESPPVHRNED